MLLRSERLPLGREHLWLSSWLYLNQMQSFVFSQTPRAGFLVLWLCFLLSSSPWKLPVKKRVFLFQSLGGVRGSGRIRRYDRKGRRWAMAKPGRKHVGLTEHLLSSCCPQALGWVLTGGSSCLDVYLPGVPL